MQEGYLYIMSRIHKSFKIRAYPTQEQRRQFARAEGATRYVHNRVLRAMDEHQKATGGYKSFIDMSREVTQWKKDPETLWLKELLSTFITQELRDLQTAFGHFFAKRAQYPNVRGGVNPRREVVAAVSPMDSCEPQITNIKPTKVLPNEARMLSAV